MKTLLRKCIPCNQYTFKAICAKCGSQTTNPIPARFSPEDRYGRYRRMLKEKER